MAIAFVVGSAFVMLSAVDLDHEPVAYQEIHPTDTGDHDLSGDRQSASKVLPDARLRAALTHAVGAADRDSRSDEEWAYVRAAVKDAVDAQLGCRPVGTSREIGEGRRQICQELTRLPRWPPPVHDRFAIGGGSLRVEATSAVGGRPEGSSLGRHAHMRWPGGGQDPDAMMLECGSAGEDSAYAASRAHVSGGCRAAVPAPSQVPELTRVEEGALAVLIDAATA